MDRLGILQKVYEHSKKMKARAVTETGACMYRTEDGNKCFIGCLFPDELYVPSCEGSIFDLTPEIAAYIGADLEDEEDVGFLEEIQECHDGAKTIKEARERLVEMIKEQLPSWEMK